MRGTAVRFVYSLLAGYASLLAGGLAVSAEEFRPPETSVLHVDWRAAQNQLRVELATAPSLTADFSFSPQHRLNGFNSRALPAWVALNAATEPVFAGIAKSAVPVLLPFDTAGFLQARQNGAEKAVPVSRYQADFRSVDFFDAGPSGYDAVFSLEPGAGDGLPSRVFAKPVEVQITGSLLIYDVADPAGGKGEPVKSLAAQYPDLRRFIREGYVRYAFTRFDVPYVVSIQCLDSAPRPRRLACREAYPIAERFLRALHVAGGRPAPPRQDAELLLSERPTDQSAGFTYRPVGDLIQGSGFHHQSGRADPNVYSQIRFPLNAPAFLHSQSFGKRRSTDKSDSPSGGYPWRDSFCEARSFNVGQCATGFGHQGQDIRPAPCPPDTPSSVCDPKRQPIFAVRDAVVLRSRQQQAATLQVNSTTEHIRFRYMHMNPSTMDADRLLNGREVFEGEQIGVVSNYLDHPNGTSRHLHFDVQVFTRDGWIWVNPYVTLIAAYERLIHGRGHEIGPQIAASPVAHALPEDVVKPDPQEGSEN
ncbi:MAG TPA: M23 family peptidase [Bradyrhizobium sp.]|nr:M23 family peptidase [Bradyrhizobium sp.]